MISSGTPWEEVYGLKPLQIDNHRTYTRYSPSGRKILQAYSWITEIDYQGYTLNWLECKETITWTEKNEKGELLEKTKTSFFTHVTNLSVHRNNVMKTSETGRLRWKIENEGLNTLKNGGYGMQHQWSRRSYQGLKNYYQFMQIGHLINQLMTKSVEFQSKYLQGKNHPTLKSFWEDMIAALVWVNIKTKKLKEILQTRRQFILVT